MSRYGFHLIRLISFLGLFGLLQAAQARKAISLGTCQGKLAPPTKGISPSFFQPNFISNECKVLAVRGGSESESDGYDDEEEDLEEVSSPEILDQAIELAKSSILMIGKIAKSAAIQSYKAIQRAIRAGLEGESNEEEEGIVIKVIKSLTRMIRAAFTLDSDDGIESSGLEIESPGADDGNDGDSVDADSDKESVETPTSRKADFGSFLSNAYGVEDLRPEDGPQFLGGTLAAALETARSQARMLVVFLPSKRPTKGKKSKDQLAVESLLSSQVVKAANKRARKKGGESGSFLFWGAKAGSSEAATAAKKLKTKGISKNGEKRPVLAVVYPSRPVISTRGAKIPLKLLAQHHCSPPPTPELMASWLDSLRKRHAKQYLVMQTDLKEAQYSKERREGYSESIKSDIEKKKREKEEAAKRLAEEEAEKARVEALEKRREELRETLPEEDTSKDAKKIAVRFADGRSGQRQFSPNQPVSDLFNWVDAMYEIEREKVVLTAMNGKRSFTWSDEDNYKSLKDSGLGRNTGFRVTEKKEEADKREEEESNE
eukprot:scaffold1669_cov129-Cylindrotheca_fusiformis.AAC.6